VIIKCHLGQCGENLSYVRGRHIQVLLVHGFRAAHNGDQDGNMELKRARGLHIWAKCKLEFDVIMSLASGRPIPVKLLTIRLTTLIYCR